MIAIISAHPTLVTTAMVVVVWLLSPLDPTLDLAEAELLEDMLEPLGVDDVWIIRLDDDAVLIGLMHGTVSVE